MATRSDASEPAVDELRRRARRRLVGAVVLALAAAVLLPLLLESEPKPLGDDVSIQIPPIDSGKFINPLSSAKAPDPKVKGGTAGSPSVRREPAWPASGAAPPAAPPDAETGRGGSATPGMRTRRPAGAVQPPASADGRRDARLRSPQSRAAAKPRPTDAAGGRPGRRRRSQGRGRKQPAPPMSCRSPRFPTTMARRSLADQAQARRLSRATRRR